MHEDSYGNKMCVYVLNFHINILLSVEGLMDHENVRRKFVNKRTAVCKIQIEDNKNFITDLNVYTVSLLRYIII